MDSLREATRVEHRRAELLPFAAALAAGNLPLESYVGFLGALLVIHSSLEQTTASANDDVVREVWDDSLRQTPRLQRDIAFFQSQRLPKSPVVSIRAQLVAQRIRQRADVDPLSLLGYLYVFTGATLGGAVLKDQVAHAFGLHDSNGLAYLSSHDDDGGAWKSFRRRMNAASLGETERSRIVDAANEAFASMARIIEALYPFDTTNPTALVQTLNWEAGRHGVPQDEREINAALRAGERSWNRYPYYKWRYGSRGARFTRSDSAWLVTLAGHAPAVMAKQITWLGQVLSARGMPQWLLEHHLVVLHEELVTAVPENASNYGGLQRAAEMLGTARRTHVSDEVMAACASTFERHVGDDWSRKMPEAGSLLAAAVADEKLGITLAVPSVETWMVDKNRFPDRWIEAVHATIRMARERAR